MENWIKGGERERRRADADAARLLRSIK